MPFEHLDRDAIWPNMPLFEEMDQPFQGYWRPGLTPHSQAAEWKDNATADYWLSVGNELFAEGWPVYHDDPFPQPDLDEANNMFDGIQVTWGILGNASKYPATGLDGWASSVNAACRFDLTLYPMPGSYPYFRIDSGIIVRDYPAPIDFNDVWESMYARTVARIRRCLACRKIGRGPRHTLKLEN